MIKSISKTEQLEGSLKQEELFKEFEHLQAVQHEQQDAFIAVCNKIKNILHEDYGKFDNRREEKIAMLEAIEQDNKKEDLLCALIGRLICLGIKDKELKDICMQYRPIIEKEQKEKCEKHGVKYYEREKNMNNVRAVIWSLVGLAHL